MKNTYYLLGNEGIEILEEDGFEELLAQIQERTSVYSELICDIVKFSRDSDPDEIMETVCGYTDYLKIDQEMYEQIEKAINNEIA